MGSCARVPGSGSSLTVTSCCHEEHYRSPQHRKLKLKLSVNEEEVLKAARRAGG